MFMILHNKKKKIWKKLRCCQYSWLKASQQFFFLELVLVVQRKSTLVNRVFAYILIPNNSLPVINFAHWCRSGGGGKKIRNKAHYRSNVNCVFNRPQTTCFVSTTANSPVIFDERIILLILITFFTRPLGF